eukprot:scaffold3654_cov115-Isochrysis_galbana.AAC.7
MVVKRVGEEELSLFVECGKGGQPCFVRVERWGPSTPALLAATSLRVGGLDCVHYFSPYNRVGGKGGEGEKGEGGGLLQLQQASRSCRGAIAALHALAEFFFKRDT